MFFIDISNIFVLLSFLIISVILIFLSRELKKSFITLFLLAVFLILIIIHVIQLCILPEQFNYLFVTHIKCMIYDLFFIGLTFVAYLWIDDIEAKEINRKSTKKSVDWFWKQI